ncbi:TonB-dependent receptor [Novosphingobium mangrovi (ex Huang et al. 2023)]|uniref:TonB-dependent receptor n=1 Tax=Novosphingobium mangrovi (ex Huang et al. 2023) TaxID=2976432 RepID=A0ABT2I8Q8_9SPHN|nr:TonB-dependent receptor [Novosphingobium mangrovi (ex Huang et al. 2023)]MCT2401201.1 TonB-dependent receptor [Novosphingobium mangrovi (ex Huang et al. 2023)]
MAILKGIFSASVALAALAPASVYAQVAGNAGMETDAVSAEGGIAAGDIIVTARRRAESLQRTPVSVAALTSEALKERAISSEDDLQISSPGLTVRSSQNSNQLNYVIRGQSLDAFSNTVPGVLPYFNEVPLSTGIAGASAFYDLESIQVLKGPQGTLFGRNATGGAVLFTTARPAETFGGYLLGRGGNFRAIHAEGAINVPLADGNFIVRLAGVHQYRDGFQENLNPSCRQPYPLFGLPQDPSRDDLRSDRNCTIGVVDRTGGRLTILARPAPGVENTFVADYLKSGGSSTTGVLYSILPTGLVPGIGFTDVSSPDDYLLGPEAGAAYAAATPHLPDGGLPAFLELQRQRGPYKVDIDGLNSYDSKALLISNATSVDVGPATKIKLVLGYIDSNSTTFSDIDGTPFGIDSNGFYPKTADGEPLGRRDKLKSFSSELQLQGTAAAGNLDYVLGAFFSKDKIYNLTTSDLFDFPGTRVIQVSEYIKRNTTYAVFGQGTYDLGDALGVEGLSFTAGLRYTNQESRLRHQPRDFNVLAPEPGFDFKQNKSFDSVSWTLGLQYQATPDTLIYLAQRRSYRLGGLNGLVKPFPISTEEGGTIYGTESLTDLELGLKHQGRGAMPYHINIALYQSWIRDAQRVAYTLVGISPAAVTVNVPKARVRGAELDAHVDLTHWLTVGGQLNFTDADFTDNLVSVAGGTPVEFGTYPDVAKWSGAAFANVSVPLSSRFDLSVRGDVYAQSKVYFVSTANLNPGAVLPGYALVNLRAQIADNDTGFSVAAIVKNVTKKEYWVGGVALGELFQSNSAVPGSPRTWMLEARYQF